jgi:glycerophosphoryl diester phosphodiesterase
MLSIGHRGAKGHLLENTPAAFLKGIELGADMLELDINLSSDGEFVVIHDPTLDRTTDGKGRVSEKTIKEIKSLNIEGGQKVPTLIEVIDLVDRRVPMNIEIKNPSSAAKLADVLKIYFSAGWTFDDFRVSSFDHNELMEFSGLLPGVKTGAIIVGTPFRFAAYAADFGAHSINIPFETADERLIDDAHKRGMEVYMWNLNEPDNFADMCRRYGADGCITDFPDRVGNK